MAYNYHIYLDISRIGWRGNMIRSLAIERGLVVLFLRALLVVLCFRAQLLTSSNASLYGMQRQ